jgi:CheY-like chemotaxis protein
MVAHGIRRMEILLVEDDEGDVVITREALDKGDVNGRLHVAGDGLEALDYLPGAGREGGGPWPDLILLDLSLPKRRGLEVLAEVKSDPDLRRIPVIVLTTSHAEEDVLRSYDLHADAFVPKPVDFQRFVEVVRRIDDFFVSVARLPAAGRDQPAGE